MREDQTNFMIVREQFHAARSPATAKAYADAALVEKDFGTKIVVSRAAVLMAVSAELTAAKFADDALRCKDASDEEVRNFKR